VLPKLQKREQSDSDSRWQFSATYLTQRFSRLPWATFPFSVNFHFYRKTFRHSARDGRVSFWHDTCGGGDRLW
jgi:hypothetical protein